MCQCGQLERPGFLLEAASDQGRIQGRWQFPDQTVLAAARRVVNQELHDHSLRQRQHQRLPVAAGEPGRPVAQGAGVAAGGVRRDRFRQEFTDRVRRARIQRRRIQHG